MQNSIKSFLSYRERVVCVQLYCSHQSPTRSVCRATGPQVPFPAFTFVLWESKDQGHNPDSLLAVLPPGISFFHILSSILSPFSGRIQGYGKSNKPTTTTKKPQQFKVNIAFGYAKYFNIFLLLFPLSLNWISPSVHMARPQELLKTPSHSI